MRKGRIALAGLAAAAVALSLVNASWIAGTPPGQLVVVGHRGTAQPIDRAAAGDGCSAHHIRPIVHTYIENTIFAMQGAVAYGARGFALDVQPTADGHAVIFRDATLECRTNGTGRVRDRPLAYLQQLDVGYGYTPDGGRTFPLRGRGVGAMPSAAEVIRRYPREQLIFELREPAAADAIVAAFREAGQPIATNHGFAGAPPALARLRSLTRAGWVLDRGASETCLGDYRRVGWLTIVPESCRGTALAIPRSGGWTLWGWPYRFLNRLGGAGARFLIIGDGSGGELVGLDQPEQLGEVPHDYRGLLLIEDMYDVGRSLQR
ncbi:MAG TPA: glycerophosphodiester phosphodiesterase family protein [Allosphingosinicella sp.]|jgi:glycerophosphoryl diester phosphodiesterase|nr:glycerophosphodiester phosphodiesterase family protein [Allosphingosinicella sp.]